MKMKFIILIILILLPILISAAVSSAQEEPVEILFFFSKHCPACQKVKEEIIPRIKEKYGSKIQIKELDFDKPKNFVKYLELQDKYNWHPKENLVPTIFIEGKFLVGSDNINNYLEIYIDTALSDRGQAPITGIGLRWIWLAASSSFRP